MGDLISVLTKRLNRGIATSRGGMPMSVAVISVLKMILWAKIWGILKFLKMVVWVHRFLLDVKMYSPASGLDGKQVPFQPVKLYKNEGEGKINIMNRKVTML